MTGAWPPGSGGILIEQQALSVLGAKPGEQINLRTANGMTSSFNITGLVHDIVLPQAEMENMVYAYISRDSLTLIGESAGFNELNITLANHNTDRAYLRAKAREPDSEMLNLSLIKGRWLGDRELDMVINQAALEKLPWLDVGDTVLLNLDGEKRSFRICGTAKMLGSQQAFIQNTGTVAADGSGGMSNACYITGEKSDRNSLYQLKNRTDKQLRQQGYEVPRIFTSWEIFKSVEDHFVIIFNLIMILTFIVIIIGGNGIILTMTTNIMERTREIGVIKAIGSSQQTLFRMIVGEGMIIGTLSWLGGAILTIPLSAVIGYALGTILLNLPLQLVLDSQAFLSSLIFMLVVSGVACFFPAYRTATRPTHEALVYE